MAPNASHQRSSFVCATRNTHQPQPSQVSGCITICRDRIDLGDVTAVYLRPYESSLLPFIADAGPGSEAARHASLVDDILTIWSDLTPAFVVNPLASMSPNGSKPYQLQQIRNLGWSVPETLVTTDPDAACAFWEQHGEVVYKSVSSIRSRVSRLRPEHRERFSNVSFCPTQFQRYIPGIDHRVHVVGTEVFACEVRSVADDYRYPGEGSTEIRACTLSSELEDRCRTLAAGLKLPVAGIDLRRTPEDDWICFEVNPSAGFTYYESASGLPIAQAVARLLVNPPATPAPCQTALEQKAGHPLNRELVKMLTSAWRNGDVLQPL